MSKLPEMSDALKRRLALHLKMDYEIAFGRRPHDRKAASQIYSDAELMDWLDAMDRGGRTIANTGYCTSQWGNYRG